MGVDRAGNGKADDKEFASLVRFEKFRICGPETGGKGALLAEIRDGRLRDRLNDWAPLKEFGETLLLLAVRADDLELIDALLRSGADPNRGIAKPTRMKKNEPPIRWAASVQAARLLLDAGADPNLRDAVDNPPLVNAVDKGRAGIEIAELLIARGADPLALDGMGRSVIAGARHDSPEAYAALMPMVIARLQSMPGGALRAEPRKRASRDFITSFAKPRLVAGAAWLAVLTPLSADRLAELVLETHAGTRIERHAKSKRVIAADGAFVFKERTAPHSSAIMVDAAIRLPKLDAVRALAARCAAESAGATYVMGPTWIERVVEHASVRERFWRSADEHLPSTRAEIQSVLAKMEAYCAEHRLHLPPCGVVGGGLECAVVLHDGSVEDYDPFHVVVLRELT